MTENLNFVPFRNLEVKNVLSICAENPQYEVLSTEQH